MSRDPCLLGPLINTKSITNSGQKAPLSILDISLRYSSKVPDNGAEGLCFGEMLQTLCFQESRVRHFLAWLPMGDGLGTKS